MSVGGVVLLLIPSAVGAAAGYVMGGRLLELTKIRFRALWLLFLAAFFQAAQYYIRPVRDLIEHRLGLPILGLVFALVAIWLVVNLLWWPTAIRLAAAAIFLGAALNGLVIAVNGRMPYSQAAAERAGIQPGITTPKNMPAGKDTKLEFLGDVVPVRPLHKAISPGDALIGLGASSLIAAAMRKKRQAGASHDDQGGGEQ